MDNEAIKSQIENLNMLERAYSTDIFGPVEGDPIKKTGEYATKENRNLITRNSAAMGRFLYERHMGPAAKTLELLLAIKVAAEAVANNDGILEADLIALEQALKAIEDA